MRKCEDYETFTRNITKRAFRVGMDISVMKIQSVGQRTISVVFWLDLSFIDNRLRICNCQSNEDNMRNRVQFRAVGRLLQGRQGAVCDAGMSPPRTADLRCAHHTEVAGIAAARRVTRVCEPVWPHLHAGS